MKAMMMGTNGHLKWAEAENPQIREDEVLLEVHSAESRTVSTAKGMAGLFRSGGGRHYPAGWKQGCKRRKVESR